MRELTHETPSFIERSSPPRAGNGLTLPTIARDTSKEMKTQGEIEALVCQGLASFQQEYMGRGPKDIRAHLIVDLLLVRMTGVLTAAEQHLAQSLTADKGRDLLKQVRTHLIETALPVIETMVEASTGVKVVSMHHDISTVTGEMVMVFSLAESPLVREKKNR